MTLKTGAHKTKHFTNLFPKVIAKSLWHYKVLYDKSKIQQWNETNLNYVYYRYAVCKTYMLDIIIQYTLFIWGLHMHV